MLLFFLIFLRGPPRRIEFPKRSVSGAATGQHQPSPEKWPHREVLAFVWTARKWA